MTHPSTRFPQTREIEGLLRLSETGSTLLDFATGEGIGLAIDPQAGFAKAGGYVRPREGGGHDIVLCGPMSAGSAAHQAAKILRLMQQEKVGVSEALGRTPAESLWINRLRQADAEATAAAVCWQIRKSGEDGPWQDGLVAAGRLDVAEAYASAVESGKPAGQAAITACLSNERRLDEIDHSFIASAPHRMAKLAPAWASGTERPDPSDAIARGLGRNTEGLALRDPLFMGRPDAIEAELKTLAKRAEDAAPEPGRKPVSPKVHME